ncbi:hypothetical protein G3572_04115 [Rhodobacter sp. ETT8]|uniref:Porin n=1 Tax=Pseudotabrizicola algicola TaxID=2709381 RepID=A0A6B3RJK1_9RHOB|nr:hypothetical protein [Pseudotabrizicola algicola]
MQAFEANGGSLSLGYSTFFGSSPATDVNKLSFGSALEFGLTPDIALQGDFAYSKFDATGLSNTGVGLHGIYHLNESTSLGAFIGRDNIDGRNLNYYGVEVAHQMGMFETEAFVTIAKDGGKDGTVFGLKGDYVISDAVTVGARFDQLKVEGADAAKFAVTGEVAALPGLNLTGELGRGRIKGYGADPYVGVGVKVNFGAKNGATFGNRSILDLLPGG